MRTPADDKTLILTVKNTGFLLDRLGQDCHPLQFLRELTQNSIESILKNGGKGDIVWDVDWLTYDLDNSGVYKLAIIDNGIGMTGAEMVEYINQLSSSGNEQSFSGNYGVGAKISAATRNHYGVLYLSWKKGKGAMIHLWRNPRTGEYGLKQFQKNDNSYTHFLELEDDVKPSQIKDNGTMVVLLGNQEKQNTMEAPEGTPSASRWIAKYLNTRYFKFPSEVTIKTREGWQYPRTASDRNKLRTIMGQEKYLNDHARYNGKVNLTNGIAHWWILKDSEAISQDSNYIASAGHTAALYQNELYEMEWGRARTARLQEFGIIFGYSQVVIYIEPKAENDQRIITNTARTNLLINGEPLPWDIWAQEFREKMPEEIGNLIHEKAAASAGSDHGQTIRERLKAVLDLFKVSRYRPAPRGSFKVEEAQGLAGGSPASQASPTQSTKSGGGSSGNLGGRAGGVYSVFEKKDGIPADKVQPDIFPTVTWISSAKGNRESGDLEDRAARFILDQNQLLINEDFRVFGDMITKFKKEYGDNDAFVEVIKDVVHAWFEQALTETVMGIQALQSSREWSIDDIKRATSEEGLTAAVMQRWHVHLQIKRELGAKLGKLQPASA